MPAEDPPTSASFSSPSCGVAGTVTSMVTVVISRGSSIAEVVVSTTGRVVRVGCTRNVVAFCLPVTATVRCSDVEVGISSLVHAKVSTAAVDIVASAGAVSDGSASTVVTLTLVDGFSAAATVELGAEITVKAVVEVATVVVGSTAVVSVAEVGCCEGAELVDGAATKPRPIAVAQATERKCL